MPIEVHIKPHALKEAVFKEARGRGVYLRYAAALAEREVLASERVRNRSIWGYEVLVR